MEQLSHTCSIGTWSKTFFDSTNPPDRPTTHHGSTSHVWTVTRPIRHPCHTSDGQIPQIHRSHTQEPIRSYVQGCRRSRRLVQQIQIQSHIRRPRNRSDRWRHSLRHDRSTHSNIHTVQRWTWEPTTAQHTGSPCPSSDHTPDNHRHNSSRWQSTQDVATGRIYQRLITQYHDNSGKTRHFPERTVLGADKILVRMWHEHHKSKNYTAVTLGEIITNRTFTALGTVNSTVKKDKLDKTLTIDTSNNTLIQQEQKDWDPQTSMMILDALDAIQWAWILILNSEQRTKSPPTSNVSRLSHVGTATDFQTLKHYGTLSHGR